MTSVTYADVEDLVKAWVSTLGVLPSGGKVFLAMPKGSPLPTITLSRVGGGPSSGSHVPVDVARISIAVWAKDRPSAKEITKKLVSAVDQLAEDGGYESVEHGGRINVGTVLNQVWLPDPVSDTPRYIVDVRLTVTTL